MITEKQIDNRIQELLNSDFHYFISLYEDKYGRIECYSELEDYMLKKYIDIFSVKVTFLIFRLISFFKPTDVYIELTEIHLDFDNIFDIEPYKNIRDRGFLVLDSVLQNVIKKGGTTINIYIKKNDTLIYISDGFNIVVFSEDKQFIKTIKESCSLIGLNFVSVK